MTAPEITVGAADAGDTEIVAGLIGKLLSELGDGTSPDWDRLRGTTRDVLEDPHVTAFLARADGRAVGVILLNRCVAIYAGGVFGEISELYVADDMRSRGVARILLERAAAHGLAMGWHRLEVGAPDQPRWQRSLAFYLREGFQEVGPRLRRLL